MKKIHIPIKIILSTILLCIQLHAQYDTGTIIFSESNESNLNSILNNYELADFNNDEILDIIVIIDSTQNQSNNLTWYMGDGAGNFTLQQTIATIEDSYIDNKIFTADMNSDDFVDIVFQNSETSFTTYLNNGQGLISNQLEIELELGDSIRTHLKEIADYDGDGDMDGIFFAINDSIESDFDFGHLLIAYNNGSGQFPIYDHLQSGNPDSFVLLETGDFDGDGDIDIISTGHPELAYANSNQIGLGTLFLRIYENLYDIDTFAIKEIILPTMIFDFFNSEFGPVYTNIRVEDINMDETAEILIEYGFLDFCTNISHASGCTFFYQFQVMDYDALSEDFLTLQTYDSWLHGYTLFPNLVGTRDLYFDAFHIAFGQENYDNFLDILSVNVPQGKIFWHLGDGQGDFTNTELVSTNSQYSSIKPAIRTADLDQDNDLDVFVLLNDEISSQLTVYRNMKPKLGADEITNFTQEIIISPNPTNSNSYVQVKFPKNEHNRMKKFRVFNLKGEIISNGLLENNEIFVGDLPAGMYLVEILDGNNRYSDKIIID